MTETDLTTFEYREFPLRESTALDTFVIESPRSFLSGMGGPVYASVGQIKEFEN